MWKKDNVTENWLCRQSAMNRNEWSMVENVINKLKTIKETRFLGKLKEKVTLIRDMSQSPVRII